MSTHDTESPPVAAKAGNPFKLVIILAGGAFVCSLAAMVVAILIMLRPVDHKIDESTEAIKEAIDASGVSSNKMMASLRDACIDWQAVLKKSSENPDAVYKIEKMPDGYLTLKPVDPAAAEAKPFQ